MHPTTRAILLLLAACLPAAAINARGEEPPSPDRWKLNPSGGITWVIDGRLPHADHVEMSGEQVSAILRYGVDAAGAFSLEYSFSWPMLRVIPNITRGHLTRRVEWNVLKEMLVVDGRRVGRESVKSIVLDGAMTVTSQFAFPKGGKLELTRLLFPTPTLPHFHERDTLRHAGQTPHSIEAPDARAILRTDAARGVDGEYIVELSLAGIPGRVLQPGDSIVLHATLQARRPADPRPDENPDRELARRRELIGEWRSSLDLETPDSLLNTMFALAKIRAAESVYKTRGGYMHAPGGEVYHAAIWANDQAEYANPLFPFLGYAIADSSAMNSFRHFARFMNGDYAPLPSSIIAEGADTWQGAGDRGDAAMIAHGAARYALAGGDIGKARALWPLVEWCLEYCRRHLNADGVVTSDSDELEGRFPAGDANLCTSSLYHDALLSAVYLCKSLNIPHGRYARQAEALRAAIDRHFGAIVEGFDTYAYFRGHQSLRAWIGIPLAMGIFDRKAETIRALFSPKLWTDDGLLTQSALPTYWDRATLYALRGVYAAGDTGEATRHLLRYTRQRLLGDHAPYAVESGPGGDRRQLSAESALYARVITEGLFGIRPTGLSSFTVSPRLPAGWDEMTLRNIRAFGGAFTLRVARHAGGIRLQVLREGRPTVTRQGRDGDAFSIHL
ncbi:MAG: hypothetical protein LBI96_00235 [Odoribacteraceae bacterium]|jgi:hypothetical protein|nr:hypothetical protein [Odoribacteraceae bacterium]